MVNEYIMTQDELHRVQDIQEELLQEVDRICRKCGIHYNMVGGTMLGAIRHKGFIPWDDDADIGLLRKEYERFREACKTELNTDKYYFQEISITDGYRWGYAKLRKKGTKFVRLGQEFMKYEQGVFIDLFPMDNVPDNPIVRKIHFFNCFLVRKFLWSAVGKNSESNKWIRFLFNIMQLVPLKVLQRWIDFLSWVSSHKKTELVRIITIPLPKGTYGFQREWFLKQRRYQFHTIRLTGARDYDGYLKYKYGNYMDLPPEDQREVHAISELDLGNEER